MVRKIFINYRRDDCIATAGRLHDRLASAFGSETVFMDVDHIPAGVDFRRHLEAQIAACDVVLVLIGPGWLNAKDNSGRRRLDSSADFVRVEIATALAREVRTIPVLVDGARMPAEHELPQELEPLAFRNAVEIRNTQFGSDVQRLIEKVRETQSRSRIAAPSVWLGAALGLILLLGLFGILRYAPRPAGPTAVSPPATTPAPGSRSAPNPAGISRIRLRQAVLVRASEADWQWIEKDPRDNREFTFHFRQQPSSGSDLLLYDQSRDMYARLDFVDRRAYWRIGTEGAWNWNYDILGAE